jgi:signal transduction histidine kinase
VLSRSTAVIGVLFALQAAPLAFEQWQNHNLQGATVVAGALLLALLLMVITAILQRGVRPGMAVMPIVYLLALLAWQPLMVDPQLILAGTPWLWYLCTVATSAAALAWNPVLAGVYTLITPAAFGVLRTLPSGGDASVLLATLDTLYAILLGLVVLVIIALLRQSAASVDEAQARALSRYSTAVRQHARDVERVEVDSLVHDNVLATLLAAAGASTPQTTALAATMASQSIERLGVAVNPAPEPEMVSLATLQERFRDFLDTLSAPVIFHEAKDLSLLLPTDVADALFAATVQAVVNSVQHAAPSASAPFSDRIAAANGDLQRTVTLRAVPHGGVRIEVSDQGQGFTLDEVPEERIGLRVSIRERVAAVGGHARVLTAPGQGTVVTLLWNAKETP